MDGKNTSLPKPKFETSVIEKDSHIARYVLLVVQRNIRDEVNWKKLLI